MPNDNPLDVPKSKIPVLGPPYLDQDFLNDLHLSDKKGQTRGVRHKVDQSESDYLDFKHEQIITLGLSSSLDILEDEEKVLVPSRRKKSRPVEISRSKSESRSVSRSGSIREIYGDDEPLRKRSGGHNNEYKSVLEIMPTVVTDPILHSSHGRMSSPTRSIDNLYVTPTMVQPLITSPRKSPSKRVPVLSPSPSIKKKQSSSSPSKKSPGVSLPINSNPSKNSNNNLTNEEIVEKAKISSNKSSKVKKKEDELKLKKSPSKNSLKKKQEVKDGNIDLINSVAPVLISSTSEVKGPPTASVEGIKSATTSTELSPPVDSLQPTLPESGSNVSPSELVIETKLEKGNYKIEKPVEKSKATLTAFKLLELCQEEDWSGVEEQIRNLEKAEAVENGNNEEKKTSSPLARIWDEETGWTPLMFAVKHNKTSLADRLIKLGCNVNQRNKESHAPIHIAALHGRDETVKFLVSKKADITAVTEPNKQNCLHLICTRASSESKTAVLNTLLLLAPNETRLLADSQGRIPLFEAIDTGSKDVCRELISTKAKEQFEKQCGPHNDNPLHSAVRKRDLEMVKNVVDAGANVDAKNGQGQSALHLASAMGDENLVKFFYLCKANPSIGDKEDHTPMYLAAMNGHTQIIELLSDKFKMSVFERTKDGSTLMHIASLHGHPETAMALFRKGVPLQMPNKGGARSLHIAARHGHSTMISKLLEKGELVDAVTNENFTALHIAVECCHPAVVETLLGQGAQVHIKGGKAQETPLHIAARVDEGEKCAQMLLKSGADSNITMENGETPLHVAARHGRLRIIRLLLQDGADLQKTSKEGETPLHLACRYGQVRVVKELLQYIKRDKGEAEMSMYINYVTVKGESSLHYAAQLAKDPAADDKDKQAADSHPGKEIAKMLLDGGASVSKPTKDVQETPFHYCAREGNNDILLEMLSRMTQVECQRAVNKQSSKGWSPLLLACHQGHTAVVKTLLENHARVDVFDNDGRSALHLAAESGNQEICGILLKHKAFINAKSRVGFTALHLAATKGYTKLCLSLIQDHGASVDAVTLKKQTPLHLAAEAGQLEVCRLLMGLRASPDATDEKGQKPIHLGAQNNHSDVIKLFLKHQNSLVTSATRDGSTCAHLAAMQGSIAVLEELMKFDKQGVISARNRSTDSTVLQLAAEGGHAALVKALIDAGANPSDENRAGYTAVLLAAKNGHTNVLDVLKVDEESIKLTSRKLGLTALHIAAYYGRVEMVRELLPYISGKTPSDPPFSPISAFIRELGTESGLTPLHLASYSGEENVVRLLLNSQGVQVDAPTTNMGFNPLHLACRGGHTTVVSLLLSRSSELLESKDASGKSSLHIASIHGHLHMIEVLLGQGAEIDAIDKELWTPLICASKAGHLDVVKTLCESGASPLAKTSKGHSPIWFAAEENHINVLGYLMKKEHDSYGLLDDKEFVYNLTVCGKNTNKAPMNEFVLSSPAPVDISAKLSHILINLSTKEKERARDLVNASKHCENMAAELLALSSATESAGKILESVDRKGVEFLDVLIENEQKEVIAHTVVQRYLADLWVGSLSGWDNWKLLLLFFSFIVCPPIWIIFSLPLGHRFYKIPIIKFQSYLTSHVHLMVLFCLTSVTPIYPVLPIRTDLFPFWFEWILLAWLTGLGLAEVLNPSDKAGLGWIKMAVLVFSVMGVLLHCVGFIIEKGNYGVLLYLRNQLFGMAVLLACVQILDFLSFHYLFGPWAIIIGNLMKDLARFLAVLAIFMLGFSLVMAALNGPMHKRREPGPDDKEAKTITGGISGVKVTPLDSFELLFFALFGPYKPEELKIETLGQPAWTLIMFKIFFGGYMLVTVVVLINLLIAMMSDTYQRIQAQSDIEWKYGLAKLIRSMHRTTATPSPINLFTSWIMWIINKYKAFKKDSSLKRGGKGGSSKSYPFGKPTANEKWKAVFKKAQGPKVSDLMRLGSAGSPLHGLGSTLSFGNRQRIETVTDWPMIAKKYKALVGIEDSPQVPSPDEQQTSHTPRPSIIPNVQQTV